MDKKDEIILQQLEVIRSMSENSLRRMNDDFWGAPKKETTKKDASGTSAGAAEKDEKKAPPTATNGGEGGEGKEEELPPPEKIEDLRAELDSYIGLAEVKKEVGNLINMATVFKRRQEAGLPNTDFSLHLVFTGNPGTGKSATRSCVK